MKITNTSPLGDLDIPELGIIVKAGETVDVDAEAAARLLGPNFTKATERGAGKEATK